MEISTYLDELIQASEKIGILVRAEPLGGEGGGLCVIKGKRTLFVDIAADIATRYERTLEALASVPEMETVYLSPEVREALEECQQEM